MSKRSQTKKLVQGALAAALLVLPTVLVGCDEPPEPDDPNCSSWTWDDNSKTYQCTDTASHYYGHYYYGGSYYTSRSALSSTSSYNSYKSNYESTHSGFGSGEESTGS